MSAWIREWWPVALVVAASVAVIVFFIRANIAFDERMEAAAKWRWEHITKPQIDACYKLGGVPIYSSWDGTVERCDFPPAGRR